MKKYFVAIVGGMLVISLSGCGDKSSPAKEKASVTTYTAPPDVSHPAEEEYYPYVDMSVVLSSLSIEGTPIAFPAEVSSLGENLHYASLEMFESEGKQYYRGTVTDGAWVNAQVEIYKRDVTDTGVVYELRTNADGGILLSVNGITFGSSYEQIAAAFGEPSSVNGDVAGTGNVYYENSSYELLAFSLENGAVTSIVVRYLPQEWR